MSIIETRNLTKYYGKTRGIEDVSISIEEGEIYGFIGPNGAGKSTTIRTLLSLIYPTGGSARIFGKDTIKYGREIREDIGYLPSEVFYYDKMKVKALLAYSASFYKKDCSKRLNDLAEFMELDLNTRIEDLSYGNKKKVGIVQGLLHKPKLIILDEPTSGLDPLMQKKFFDLIADENKDGATVFFSSHILSEVQELCGRVAIIKEGSIVKIESIKALQDENYKKISIVSKELAKEDFDIHGISNFKKTDGHIKFFYGGDINKILHILSTKRVKNVLIEEPSLEEIFMHYYR